MIKNKIYFKEYKKINTNYKYKIGKYYKQTRKSCTQIR